MTASSISCLTWESKSKDENLKGTELRNSSLEALKLQFSNALPFKNNSKIPHIAKQKHTEAGAKFWQSTYPGGGEKEIIVKFPLPPS